MLDTSKLDTSKSGDTEFYNLDFPENVFISDLCDCGRHKCTHKPIQQHTRGPFPKSNYTSTYQAIQHPKPRSSKRPPVAVLEQFPAPMHFSTNQRDDFKNPGNVERAKPITNIQKYEASKYPLDVLTFYCQEFTPKQNLEPGRRYVDRRDLSHQELAQFDDRTVNKEHFKRWASQPRHNFGELPSFTGSLLFPDKGNLPQTTMRQSYQGAYTPSAALAKAIPDSLKLEGDQMFETTHNLTYQPIEGDHRTRQLTHSDNTPLKKWGEFVGITQTQEDFPGYRGGQPQPPSPVCPPLPTIDFKFNNKQSFTTENRTVFQGHDVTKHPVRKSCKMGEDQYQMPSVKFETETSQKKDYQPIDLTTLEKVHKRISGTSSQVPADIRFDGRTMNKQFFQNWRAQPRIRFGDSHNIPHIPKKDPFLGQSITKSSFVPKSVGPIRMSHPEQGLIFKDGQMSFKTEYQEEFQKKQARLCRAQVYLMQQKLKRRKTELPQHSHLENKCLSASHAVHMMTSNAGTVN